MKCHNCEKELNKKNWSHIYICTNTKNCNFEIKNEIKYKVITYNFDFDELKDKNEFEKLYKENSLPDFLNKYKLPYAYTLFLVDYYKIKKRTISEGCKKLGVKKGIQTNLERYGAVNVLSKNTLGYKKRNKTVKDKYGVDNVFQIKEIIERINTKEAHERTVKGWKKWFYALSDKEKEEFFLKSIHSDLAKQKSKIQHGYVVSKPEIKLIGLLTELNLTFIHQFKIRRPENQNLRKRSYYYDIYLPDFNLIIEMNGCYWHADPSIYKAEDIVFFKFAQIKAEEIWKRDKLKHDLAIENGYNIIVIWENELSNKKSNDEIKELLIIKINEYANSKNQINQKNNIII